MEEDEPELMPLEQAVEGGSAGLRAPELGRAVPAEADRTLDARHRRGSLGPPPAAAPLGEAASAAALHAHLAHLLDVRREPLAPGLPKPATTVQLRATPHEDLARQPDGVPHLIIGLTALFSVLLAAVLISVVRSGPTLGSIAAVGLAVVATPILVFGLGAKAERDRDHDHPSR